MHRDMFHGNLHSSRAQCINLQCVSPLDQVIKITFVTTVATRIDIIMFWLRTTKNYTYTI